MSTPNQQNTCPEIFSASESVLTQVSASEWLAIVLKWPQMMEVLPSPKWHCWITWEKVQMVETVHLQSADFSGEQAEPISSPDNFYPFTNTGVYRQWASWTEKEGNSGVQQYSSSAGTSLGVLTVGSASHQQPFFPTACPDACLSGAGSYLLANSPELLLAT